MLQYSFRNWCGWAGKELGETNQAHTDTKSHTKLPNQIYVSVEMEYVAKFLWKGMELLMGNYNKINNEVLLEETYLKKVENSRWQGSQYLWATQWCAHWFLNRKSQNGSIEADIDITVKVIGYPSNTKIIEINPGPDRYFPGDSQHVNSEGNKISLSQNGTRVVPPSHQISWWRSSSQ